MNDYKTAVTAAADSAPHGARQVTAAADTAPHGAQQATAAAKGDDRFGREVGADSPSSPYPDAPRSTSTCSRNFGVEERKYFLDRSHRRSSSSSPRHDTSCSWIEIS